MMNDSFEDNIENIITFSDPSQIPNYYFFDSQEKDNVLCRYYLITCTEDDIHEKIFVNRIVQLILRYALKKEEYEGLDDTNAIVIVKKAMNRFVDSPTTGEPGELILFSLLESEKKAPQLLNKMSLKTSKEMHYHGLDGIHIGIENGNIVLYYGESKMHQSIDGAIDKAILGLDKFHNSIKKEDFELDLISNNIDVTKFNDYVEEIKKIVNPYSDYKKDKLRKKYAVFIGFNWNCITDLDFQKITKNMKNIIEDCLKKNKDRIYNRCKSKVNSSSIDIMVEFFIIPFKDVEKFRSMFIEAIK